MAQAFRPNVVYEDQRAAIRWLEEAFGFEVALLIEGPDGELGHCQMRYGESTISIGRRWDEASAPPNMLGGRFTQSVSLHLTEDVDAHFQRAKAAGAEIVGEPTDQFYGDRSYACRDPEGHIWHISQSIRQPTLDEMEAASGFRLHYTPAKTGEAEPSSWDLERTYLTLDGDGSVAKLPVGPDFWQTIDRNPAMMANLVGVFPGEGDWPNWEMHPQGDEVLVLLEGAMRMVFERPAGEEVHEMRAGTTLVVPAGVWHRAVEQRGAKLLAITYGAGTSHKPAG